MNEIFPIGSTYESPKAFFSESIKTEQKALEVYPNSKFKKAIEAISSILSRKLDEAK